VKGAPSRRGPLHYDRFVPNPNALRWDGGPGHYEVYFVTATDRAGGRGVWIRYTLLAPREGRPTCTLWFVFDGVARTATFPIEELRAQTAPFELRIADAVLSDRGLRGAFDDVRWDLAWEPNVRSYGVVDPLAHRLGIAKTMFVVAHPDLALSGSVTVAGREYRFDTARGGQSHVWGSKHARSWVWLHCNDLETLGGERRPGFVDGVSAYTARRGPLTPMVGRLADEDFRSTHMLAAVRNASTFSPAGWRFETSGRGRRLVGEVTAEPEQLVGVEYHDPDGEPRHCYNTETASLRLEVWEGSQLRETLLAPGRAHFEYAQREPLNMRDP